MERISEENAYAERRRRQRKRGKLENNGHKEEGEYGGDDDGILTICLAINYGGRSDILQAATKLAQSIASGEIKLDDSTTTYNEELITSHLYTSNIPDVDLVIRTGGEQRISNFLLWNIAYAELYFCEVLWPDFNEVELWKALRWYGLRHRRFGGR